MHIKELLVLDPQKSDNNGPRNCRSHRSLAMRYVLTQKLWRQAGGQSVNIVFIIVVLKVAHVFYIDKCFQFETSDKVFIYISMH